MLAHPDWEGVGFSLGLVFGVSAQFRFQFRFSAG